MSKEHLAASPATSSLSRSLNASGLSYHEYSVSAMAEGVTSNPVPNHRIDAVEELCSKEMAASSLVSVDPPKQTTAEASSDTNPESAKTPMRSAGASTRSNFARDSTPQGEPTRAAARPGPCGGPDRPRHDLSEAPPGADPQPGPRGYPQSFDCFRRWGGGRSLDYGAAAARVAEVCALTPTPCLGEGDRPVVDLAATTPPWRARTPRPRIARVSCG